MLTTKIKPTSKLVQAAREYAVDAHHGQKYGKHDYVYHLDLVAYLAKPYGHFAQALGYLHDVVEDTTKTREDIAHLFGEDIAQMVEWISDEEGATRAERKLKTHAKLKALDASLPREFITLVVKLCDRLANVRKSHHEDNSKMLTKYRGEHAAFKDAVYREGQPSELWLELDRLLEV